MLVILGCAAVDSVPVSVVNIALLPPMFPTLALPPTDNIPPVNKLPPVILPIAVTNPPVVRLPPMTLPTPETFPEVSILPPVILPVAVTNPPVIKLAPVKLPVAVINPVPILPILALPETLRLANVPVLVILGCALSDTVTATLALPIAPVILAPGIFVKFAPLPIK